MTKKPQPNRQRYLKILREMTPEQRVAKAFELSDFTKQLFKHGLRQQNPELSDEELHKLYLKRLARCHNKNY